jgi:hypothetical protein
VVSGQWSVVSGQLEQVFFSWANFEKCTFFWNRMFRIEWLLVGFFVDTGEDGSEGEGFFAQRICKSPRFFGLVDVPYWIGCWWGDFGIKFRAKTRRRKELYFDWMR